jgi:succinoglycan biosynthesis transport protein ExoP
MSDGFAGFGNDEQSAGGGLPAPLRDPIGVLKRRWKIGLIAFFALAIPSALATRLIPVQFEASARMLMTSKSIPDQFVPDTIVASSIEQFQAIENRVMSRARLAKFVATDLFADERGKRSVAEITDDLLNKIQIEKKPTSDGRGFIRTVDIRISLRGERQAKIAAIVNHVVDDLLDEFLSYRNQQSQVTLDFMRREYEHADEALRAHQHDLALFREAHRGSLPEEQAATIAKLERLESQRRSTILELNNARSQLGAMRSSGGSASNGTTPREELEAKLERLRAVYTDEHPEVRALERRLAAMSDEPTTSKAPAQNSARAKAQAEIEQREARLAQINEEVGQLEAKVAETSGITEEYRALERKETVLQAAYDEYLGKFKSAELSRSMETAQQGAQLVRLEAATPPTHPVLRPIFFTAGAIVASLALSFVLIFVVEFLDPVVIDEDHLEKLSSVPILGSIPPVA